MDITPHLGIGDLLIVKMIAITHNLNIGNININKQLIMTHCENYELKVKFITKLIELLFPGITYHINNNNIDFKQFINTYKIKYVYIYDCIMKHQIRNKYLLNCPVITTFGETTDYIIFHTKMRHDNLMDRFINEMLPEFTIFFSSFATLKKIILLGERNIGQNVETMSHKTISMYNNLLLLKNNNTVIDLTDDVLTCGNPNFDKFLSDIELINKSLCNITFGIGGPFNICKAFSKNVISFIPYCNICPFKQMLCDHENNNCIVENINDLNIHLHLL